MSAAFDSAGPRPTQVLVVEDSATQALQIRHMLESRGFAVEAVASAEAALDRLNGRLPDLIIADYHLPGMNGDELSRQIRLNARTRALPLLMLTEARERHLERMGLESGADAYVAKSADWDLIVLRMRALLRRRGDQAAVAMAGTTFRRARVLLADPRPGPRDDLAALLAQEGYDVQAAGDPAAIVKVIATGDVDAVIVALHADGLDGMALCRRLNGYRNIASPSGDAATFQIVAIIGEAATTRETLTEAFAAGADDVIPADADAEGVQIRIRTLLRRKLMQDEDRRIEAELRNREIAIERARAEAAAAEAKASLADALAQANSELGHANRSLRDTQAKLVQAAKMASLGELVAGIAHEINNPLAFILAHQGTVERLLGQIEGAGDDEARRPIVAKARDRLGAMRMGLKRIEALVQNLRKFSRLDEGGFQSIDVAAAIETVLALLAPKLAGRITVQRDLRGPSELMCSPALFNQVVMNIIGNAADAIGASGSIRISTRQDHESCIIEIGDSGPGIPDEMRERIFEPFFTTKPVGTGMGLGLAIAYGIVQAHHGTIAIGGAPEGGALFTIAVPLNGRPAS